MELTEALSSEPFVQSLGISSVELARNPQSIPSSPDGGRGRGGGAQAVMESGWDEASHYSPDAGQKELSEAEKVRGKS